MQTDLMNCKQNSFKIVISARGTKNLNNNNEKFKQIKE